MPEFIHISGESVTLLAYVLVQSLHSRVVSQQIQTLAVALPQKLDPWREDGTVSSVLGVLSTDSLQEQAVDMITNSQCERLDPSCETTGQVFHKVSLPHGSGSEHHHHHVCWCTPSKSDPSPTVFFKASR